MTGRLNVPAVMAAVLGLFMLLAGFATMIPSLVHDRLPQQFIPTCSWLLNQVMDAPSEELVMTAARTSQVIIAVTELTVGVVMLAAAFWPRRRVGLTNLGVGLAVGLFGAFMMTMFAMHDKSLPGWNQYPSILAWLGATWLVVSLTDGRSGPSNQGPAA